MNKNKTEILTAIWKNFLKLINDRTGKFIAHYEERNKEKFELPKLEIDTLKLGKEYHITIPGYLGGYSYFFEEKDNTLIMYADLTSRWQYEEDYEYFEITTDGYSKLQDKKQREELAKKFFQLGIEQLKETYEELDKTRNNVKDW